MKRAHNTFTVYLVVCRNLCAKVVGATSMKAVECTFECQPTSVVIQVPVVV